MSIVAKSYGEGRAAMLQAAAASIIGKRKAAEAAYTPSATGTAAATTAPGRGTSPLARDMMGVATKQWGRKAWQAGRRAGFKKIDRKRVKALDDANKQFGAGEEGGGPPNAEDLAKLAEKGMTYDSKTGEVVYKVAPKPKTPEKKKATPTTPVVAAAPTPEPVTPPVTPPAKTQAKGK